MRLSASPIPVPLIISTRDPKAEYHHTDYLVMVEKVVNQLLQDMSIVLQSPTTQHHALILRTCFGKEHDQLINELKQQINKLNAGRVSIYQTLSTPGPGFDPNLLAAYDPKHDGVQLGPKFYRGHATGVLPGEGSQAVYDSALVFLHEATHALLKTEDWFKYDQATRAFRPLPHKPTKGVAYIGYVNVAVDFDFLRREAGAKTLIQNADSYICFAHRSQKKHADVTFAPMARWAPVMPPPNASASEDKKRPRSITLKNGAGANLKKH